MIATPFRATGFSGIPLRLLVGRDTSGNPLPVGSELEAAGYDATLRNLGSGEVAAEEWDGIVCESLEAARRVLALPGMRLPVIAICGTAAEAAEAEAAGAGGSVPRNDLRRLAVVVAHAVAEAKIGRVLDTTERELAERDRSYRLLFDRAADGIVIWHEDGRVLDVNPVFCELTGYDRAECLRLDITRFIPPSDLEREPVGGAELRAGKRKFRKRRLLRRNGETFSVEIASRKLKGSAYISIVRDITAREAAERTIRYQLSLLQATLEATRDGIAVVDRDDKLAAWNRRTAATFGLGEEEFRAGDSRRVFARMAERVTEPALFAAVLAQSGEKAHLRLSGILQTLDGRTIEYSRSPQRLGGEIIGRVWSFHDVTTRKHAVEALLASEKKYRSIVENIPEAIVVIDRAGRIRYVTPNCLPISGYTAEEWMAMSDAQRAATAHPEDLPALRRAFAALFEQGVRYDVEYRCRHRDGRWIWIHARGLRTYEHEGVLCADMIVSDITSRRKADLALREMAAVLENAVEGIARADRAGICVHANAACAAMLGRKPRDIIGQQWMAAVHPDDRERVTEGHRSMLAGQKREMEIRALAADGSLRNLRLLLIPLRDEAGEPAGHYCFTTDITRQKQSEARLEQAGRVGSLGRIAASVSHEFNNVLMGIQPFAELILRRSKDEQTEQAAQRILSSIKRGKRITAEILRFTRPVPPVLQSVEMNAWLTTLEPELREIAGRGVALRIAVDDGDVFVHCDRAQIEQVITNLVANARDAMPSGGEITLTVAPDQAPPAAVGESDGQRFARITVRDRGSGIAPELLDQIFEPLFTTKRTGTGLGLAVARQIIVQHGGWIGAENSTDGGATFHVFLPQVTAA